MESQRGDEVTDSLMAITVITVGGVNCFRSGPNDVRGCRNTIRRGAGGRKEAARVEGASAGDGIGEEEEAGDGLRD